MRELREKASLRTVDVASKLKIAESTVRNWETGKSVPHFETVKGLLTLYQCDFDELYQAVKRSQKKVNYIMRD